MSASAQVQVKKNQAPSITNDSLQSLQRKTESDCQERENRRSKMRLLRKAVNHTELTGLPFIVNDVLHSSGHTLEPTVRAFMEPRFKHDFSQVRIHADAKAAESARAVNAMAYTVGSHVVFGSNRYSPTTPGGRYLLAHELVHVTQQRDFSTIKPTTLSVESPANKYEYQAEQVAQQVTSSLPYSSYDLISASVNDFHKTPQPVLQRVGIWESIKRFFGYGTYNDEELHQYLQVLRETGRIEGHMDSDNKAQAIVERWKNGGSDFVLTPSLIILMIREMQIGYTGGDQEEAILELLERSENHQLSQIFGANGIAVRSLNSDFQGDNWQRLQDFYRRRFQGGMQALLQGRVNPIGQAVPLGTPLSSAAASTPRTYPGDDMQPAVCCVREPGNCHTYEEWLSQFQQFREGQDAFRARSGHLVIGGAPAPQATAVDPTAPQGQRRPPLVQSARPYLRTDPFIDGPTEAWLRANLPPNLVEVAYQLPSDCADMAVILRHVWLVAHRRTERYRGWLCGAALDDPRSRQIRELILQQISSRNVRRIVRPYTGTNGAPVLNFTSLQHLLHPGDVLVWEHRDSQGRRFGGHTQTIMEINRNAQGEIISLRALQGNQPISRERAEEIHGQGGGAVPSVSALRAAPGRRIEISVMSGAQMRGEEVNGVWTRRWRRQIREGDREVMEDVTDSLLAAGPPSIARQPGVRAGRRGQDVVRGLEDWEPEVRRTGSINELQSIFEAALLEARSLIEGGQADSLSEGEAQDFGRASGSKLWQLAREAARRRASRPALQGVPQRIRDPHLYAEDLGEESHYRPMRHMIGMLQQFGSSSRSRLTSTRFSLIATEFERAARGISSVQFQRSGVSSATQNANILVTGFDPFRFNRRGQVEPRPGDWNPSGAAVLQLDGLTIPVQQGLNAAVEGVVLPVRYDAFRSGIVESMLRPHIDNVDGVLTVSMDPNISPTDPPEIERFAVGVHRLNNGRLESIPPAPGSGGDPGPAIIESRGPIPDIAREAGLPVSRRQGDTRFEFQFISASEADRALTALGLQPQGQADVSIDNLAAIRQIANTMERGVQSPGITFRVGSQSFQAVILRGPGGSFLSNEVSYRVLRMIGQSQQRRDITSFHVHTPRGDSIPQAVRTRAERQTRFSAIQAGRRVVTRLVNTLKEMIKAIARRIRRTVTPTAGSGSR